MLGTFWIISISLFSFTEYVVSPRAPTSCNGSMNSASTASVRTAYMPLGCRCMFTMLIDMLIGRQSAIV